MAMSTKDHKIELAKASAAFIMQQNVYRLRLLPILQRAGSAGVDAATMVQLIESWLGELLETLAKSSGVNRLRPVDVFRNIPDIRMENRPAGWYWVLASFPMKQSADDDSPKGSHPWDASIGRAGSDQSVDAYYDGSTAEFTRMTSGIYQKSRVYPSSTTTVKDKNERLKLAARSAAAFVLKTNVYQKELIPMLEEAGDNGVDGATMVAFVERELGAMLGHHAKLGKVTKLRAVDVFRNISDIRMEKRLDGWHWILAAPGQASQIDDEYNNNNNNNHSPGITTATATMNESFQYKRAILAGHNGEWGNQESGAAMGVAEAGQNKGFGSFFNTEEGHYCDEKEQQKLAARSAATFVLKTNVYHKQLIPMLEEAGDNGLDGAKMVSFVERELGSMLAHHARLGRVPRLTAVEVFRNIPQIQMQRRGKVWYWVLASVPSGSVDISHPATSSSAAAADGYNTKVTAASTASAAVSLKKGNYTTNAANIDSRELFQEEYVGEQEQQQPQLEQQQQQQQWMTKQQIAAAAAAGAVVKCHVFRKTIIPMLQEAGSIGVKASTMTEIVKRELTPLLKYHARENDVQWLTPVEVFQEIPHISFVQRAGVKYWLLTSALSEETPAERQEQQQLQQEHQKEQLQQQLLQSEYVKCSGNEPTTESSASSIASSITSIPLLSDIDLIDTLEKLEATMHQWPYNSSAANPHPEELPVVAIDCEGVPERLLLIQIATADAAHVFDCVALGASTVCSVIGDLLANRGVVKLFHDLHNDAFAFSRLGSFSESMRSCFDTQLAMESLTNNMLTGFHSMLAYLDMPALQSIKKQVQHQMKSESNGPALLMMRPMDPETLAWVANDVRLLQRAFLPLVSRLQVGADAIICASDERARVARSTAEHARQMCFDKANDCAVASPELLSLLRPKDVLALGPPRALDESEALMSLLPFDIALELLNKTHQLCDIALDKGRRAHALIGDQRVMLGAADRLVTAEEITKVTDGLGVGQDQNRVCIEQQLHRISVLRNRINEPIGLTIRVGRHVEGNSGMISDLLFSDRSKSILVLGEPGSGKTTLLRDIAKQLAEQDNVWIIDTCNEIAGDGDVPHSCVGNARRLMVNSPEEQEHVMIECVQNHTPAVMVIDEIGRPAEVEAARTCKQRGVRLIASVAHGDLRKLARNANLMDLVGAIESTTGSFPGDDFSRGLMMMGMEMKGATATAAVARSSSNNSWQSKVSRAARAAPVFDLIVELSRGKLHEWRVVFDVSQAVDQVMEGKPYRAQLRCRDADKGSLSMKYD